MLFSHILRTPQPPIQTFVTTDVKGEFSDDYSYIKSFWIKAWGNRNFDDDAFLALSEN